MNMEAISNTDFDRLENLLHSKFFNELTDEEKQWVNSLLSEEEYITMSMLYSSLNKQKHRVSIEPNPELKDKLHFALASKVRNQGVFTLKMPVYQSVGAALIFFLIGFGINLSRPIDKQIIHDTVNVIKYINKPDTLRKNLVESNPTKKKLKRFAVIHEKELIPTNKSDNTISIPESNPDLIRQQEIAMTNINRVLNEKNGTSMGGDTLLQKMMVTVY